MSYRGPDTPNSVGRLGPKVARPYLLPIAIGFPFAPPDRNTHANGVHGEQQIHRLRRQLQPYFTHDPARFSIPPCRLSNSCAPSIRRFVPTSPSTSIGSATTQRSMACGGPCSSTKRRCCLAAPVTSS